MSKKLTEQEFKKLMSEIYDSINTGKPRNVKTNILIGKLKAWEYTEILRLKKQKENDKKWNLL